MQELPLKQVADVFNGKTPSKEEQRNSGFPVLKIRDISDDGEFLRKFGSFVDQPFADEFETKIIQPGDSLILNAAHNSDYVGSKQHFVTFDSYRSLATGEWLIVRPKKTRIGPSYLNFWLQTPEAKRRIRDLVKGIHLYPKDVEELTVPVLNDKTAELRVAAVLDKADRLRRQRRYAETLSDTFLQSIFIKMFGDPVANTLNWDISLLGKSCVPKDGIKAGPFGSSIKKESYSETGYRVYGQEQVIVDDYRIGNYRISDEKFRSMKAYAVQSDDVLISLVGTFGKVSIVPRDAEPGIINPRLIRIRLDQQKLKPHFFVAMFRNQSFLNHMERLSHGGTMGVLNGGQLKETEVILPPLSLQEKFAAIVQKFESIRRQQREATRQAEHLFQTLLHRAFNSGL